MLRRASRRAFKVYTRTGDGGTSALFNMARAPKDDTVFDALGAVDELNAAVGLARAHGDIAAAEAADAARPAMIRMLDQLADVQQRLLDVGSAVATPRSTSSEQHLERATFAAADAATASLERWMDAMDESLPPLTSFILPGGSVYSASLHVARAACRRAERRVVPLVREGECLPAVTVYLNRLSDYLFVAARSAAHCSSHKEEVRRR